MKKKTNKSDDIYERDEHGHIVAEKPQFRNQPGSHLGAMGKYGGPGSGYTLYEDGTYELAPCERNAFLRLMSEEQALTKLMNDVLLHIEERLKIVQARKQEWFTCIAALLYRPDDVDQIDCLSIRKQSPELQNASAARK